MLFEQLEDRRLLAAMGPNQPAGDIVESGITQVAIVGASVRISGTDNSNEVVVNGPEIQVTDVSSVSTGFENLAGDRTDVGNFQIGTFPIFAKVSGDGVAGTRGFRPGYNNGAFALITVGTTVIDFTDATETNQSGVRVEFSLRNIVELVPDVVGNVTVVGTAGRAVIAATANGDPQSNNWDRFDSNDLGVGGVTQLIIDNGGTGVTNVDDLLFDKLVVTNYSTKNVRPAPAFIFADLRGGDDIYSEAGALLNIVAGGSGNDILDTSGRSFLFGGAGDDLLDGGDQRDLLFGQAGSDVLIAGAGADVLSGGADTDILVLDVDGSRDVALGSRVDIVLGGDPLDRLL